MEESTPAFSAFGSPSLSTPSAPLSDLPLLEQLPAAGDGAQGYDPDAVREAFAVFRRQLAQLSAQLRVVQSARPGQSQGGGHPVRLDALHLIRQAAEFADALEHDAQEAATQATAKAKQEIEEREHALQVRELELQDLIADGEQRAAKMVRDARDAATRLLEEAGQEARACLRSAATQEASILEDARHQAAETVAAARREVNETLEWARERSRQVVQLGQQAAIEFMSSAGMRADAAQAKAEEMTSSTDVSSWRR